MSAEQQRGIMNLENVPDTAKVAVSTAAPVLELFGIPVSEWTYVLSAIVSLLFIIEKSPMLYQRLKDLYEYVQAKRKK